MRFWVLHPDTKEPRGPYSVEQLKDLGWVDRESVVAREDAGTTEDWRPVNGFPELYEAFPPPVPEGGIPGSQVRSNRLAANLLSPAVLAAAAAAATLSFGAFLLGRSTRPETGQESPRKADAPAPSPRSQTVSSPVRAHSPKRPRPRKRRITTALDDGDESFMGLELPEIETVADLREQIAEDERKEREFKEALKKAIEAAQKEEGEQEGRTATKTSDVMEMSVAELENYLGRHKSSEVMAERLRCELLKSTEASCAGRIPPADRPK